MPKVNHQILRWARETAGLDLVEASRRLGIQAARSLSSAERLAKLESGESEPSRPILARMAKQYRRPLVTFYLPDPPKRARRGEDYRTVSEERSDSDEALLDALIRDIKARQSTISTLMVEEDEASPLSFVGSMAATASYTLVVKDIREALRFDLASFRAASTPEQAFGRLRDATEGLGIFVIVSGDLGTHHTSVGPETFRGIALSDPIAPFIVINSNDARPAWSFTLIHELTHIWLGQTGVSGVWAERSAERLCNDVASEFLLPAQELRTLQLPFSRQTAASLVRPISEFASERNLSGSMVAYRLYRRNEIDRFTWEKLRSRFQTLWTDQQFSRRAVNRATEGGPDFYVVRRHRVGKHLIDVVGRMMRSGAVTTIQAGHLLGVGPSRVHALIEPRP